MILVLVAFAGAASAAPSVSLSWNGCQGPLQRIAAPGDKLSLYATVIGMDQGHKGFHLRILLRPVGAVVPDAWRFDTGGCQAGLMTFHWTDGTPGCPSFTGTQPSVQISDYALDVNLNRWRLVFADAYPFGVTDSDPAVRYQMVRIDMDHTNSITGQSTADACGGVEEPMCFYLYKSEWATMDIVETPFVVGQEYLTVNDPYQSACHSEVTPARPQTWGAIRATYRR